MESAPLIAPLAVDEWFQADWYHVCHIQLSSARSTHDEIYSGKKWNMEHFRHIFIIIHTYIYTYIYTVLYLYYVRLYIYINDNIHNARILPGKLAMVLLLEGDARGLDASVLVSGFG